MNSDIIHTQPVTVSEKCLLLGTNGHLLLTHQQSDCFFHYLHYIHHFIYYYYYYYQKSQSAVSTNQIWMAYCNVPYQHGLLNCVTQLLANNYHLDLDKDTAVFT